ncbi:sulfatase-like hydrolase/transferase [Novipirellula artificiosorum]|uniref:Arylsulfatase n=1 Tax=Novipirellula artificiosorum TaxID=2528016 RepID=A0A5C6D052_9BACT|nr:sulfatase-like hydrolase/transferase [Novipirellula artificiosorum]TWU29121.1 Arylsulfatase [Novipirellula artificiosorum]
MKWNTTLVLGLLLSLAAANRGQADENPLAGRPNLVMIFTDDQRCDAIGYADNEAIQTPNLDRLARAGLIFENCFVNTSICAVNRANLLSGQYPARHGIDDFYKSFTPEQLSDSVPGRLRHAGYQTAFFGKWGVGDSPERTHQGAAVFDYWAGQPEQTNYFHESDCRYVNFDGFTRPLDDLCDCPADSRGKAGHSVRIGRENLVEPIHVDSQVTPLHVKRFLDGRDKSRPFCMMLFFKSPHSPFGDWDPSLAGAIKPGNIRFPTAATQANADREPEIVKQSLGWPAGQTLLSSPSRHDKTIRDYYRSIASMDLGVGRVMDELMQRGLDRNTAVLFTSDNGQFSGEHGLAGKWLMYEPSLRVPGFLYDPRVNGGQSTDRMVITTDFSVTMLALAGLEIPDSMTGRDLTQLAENPQAAWREDFLYDHPYGHRGRIPRTLGVRTTTHSYTRYIDPAPPFEQLFNLQTDSDQLHNLAENPEYAELLLQLRHRCDQLAAEVGPVP